jgi:hypothetical protein
MNHVQRLAVIFLIWAIPIFTWNLSSYLAKKRVDNEWKKKGEK